MELIEARAVELPPLVTAVLRLDEWEEAFEASRAGTGGKYVLDPRSAVD
jgi:threonine dehydrogenase-like Zn-dependent dehydrogenase